MLLWSLAVLLATFTAFVELIARYRDAPFSTVIKSGFFGWFYLALNGSLGAGAYYILLLTVDTADALTHVEIAVGAGLGASAVIRARVINAKIGSQEVAIGPGYVLDQLLAALDRGVDRKRAVERTKVVRHKMKDIDFERAASLAETLVPNSLQNMDNREQDQFQAGRTKIKTSDVSDQEKAYALGFLILDAAGEDFLSVFVEDDRLKSNDVDQPPYELPVVAEEDVDIHEGTDESESESAVRRAELVRNIFTGLDFRSVQARLNEAIEDGTFGESDETVARLREAVTKVGAMETSDGEKTLALGFEIRGILGEEALTKTFSHLQSTSRVRESDEENVKSTPDLVNKPQTDEQRPSSE